MFILDTGWVDVTGTDAVETIRKFADRLKYVHLKDFRAPKSADESYSDRIVPVFEGAVPFDDIIAALEEVGTCKIAYVEQDNASSAADPYGEMRISFENLKARGYI